MEQRSRTALVENFSALQDRHRPRPKTVAVVEHMAMNILRQAEPTTGLEYPRKLAGWNLDHLIRGAE